MTGQGERAMPTDHGWLERHLPHLRESDRLVLELGCGPGDDTAQLRSTACEVLSTDVSPTALGRAAARLGTGMLARVDHSRPLPFRDRAFGAVVASLTLHYFPLDTTLAALSEIHRVLLSDGVFLFRVNATDDVEHGASDGEEVEHHFRRYPSGRYESPKRFFDEADVHAAIDGLFHLELLEHRTIDRYRRPKRIWEARARVR